MENEGREPPAQFYECPEISPHLQRLWSAFIDLGTERQIGMGLGPIPLSKLKDYVRDDLDLNGDAAERAIAILRQVDGEYLSLANASKSATKDKTEPDYEVPADDSRGVKQMFEGIAVRKRAEAKAQKKKQPK